eukprot:11298163-Alexandrium_andersonii.AAC.1
MTFWRYLAGGNAAHAQNMQKVVFECNCSTLKLEQLRTGRRGADSKSGARKPGVGLGLGADSKSGERKPGVGLGLEGDEPPTQGTRRASLS